VRWYVLVMQIDTAEQLHQGCSNDSYIWMTHVRSCMLCSMLAQLMMTDI
jgi:hypothetical protein